MLGHLRELIYKEGHGATRVGTGQACRYGCRECSELLGILVWLARTGYIHCT